MANQSPFLADQLAFYQTHAARLAELQAARGKGSVDPSSFMPSSRNFDDLMAAFGAGGSSSSTSSSTTGAAPSTTPGQVNPQAGMGATGSSSSHSGTGSNSDSTSSSDGYSDNSGDFGIALGGALSSHPGTVLAGVASLATGNIPSLLRSVFSIGADTTAAYQAIQALRSPTVGENEGQTPTADLAAMAALGDTNAEAAMNYDNRVQTPRTADGTQASDYDSTGKYLGWTARGNNGSSTQADEADGVGFGGAGYGWGGDGYGGFNGSYSGYGNGSVGDGGNGD